MQQEIDLDVNRQIARSQAHKHFSFSLVRFVCVCKCMCVSVGGGVISISTRSLKTHYDAYPTHAALLLRAESA